VQPGVDQVVLDGRPLLWREERLTLLVNKPLKVLVTHDDPQGRPTIYDLLPAPFQGQRRELAYAGRLDYLTSGLLILSTDGDLIHHLTHPSNHVPRTYEVLGSRPFSAADLARLREGVALEDGPAAALAADRSIDDPRLLRLVIEEGRNRQVRRMVESLGVEVRSLCRTAIGAMHLADLELAEGEWGEIESEELLRRIEGR
jgi:23S rRNA pseudouridine2605 synthase